MSLRWARTGLLILLFGCAGASRPPEAREIASPQRDSIGQPETLATLTTPVEIAFTRPSPSRTRDVTAQVRVLREFDTNVSIVAIDSSSQRLALWEPGSVRLRGGRGTGLRQYFHVIGLPTGDTVTRLPGPVSSPWSRRRPACVRARDSWGERLPFQYNELGCFRGSFEADLRLFGAFMARGGDASSDSDLPSPIGVYAGRGGDVVVSPRGRRRADPLGHVLSLGRLRLAPDRLDRVVIPSTFPIGAARLDLSPTGRWLAILVGLDGGSNAIFVVDLETPHPSMIELVRRPFGGLSSLLWADEVTLFTAERASGRACLLRIPIDGASRPRSTACLPTLAPIHIQTLSAETAIMYSPHASTYAVFDLATGAPRQMLETERSFLTGLPDGRLVFGPSNGDNTLLVIGAENVLLRMGEGRPIQARVLHHDRESSLVVLRGGTSEAEWHRDVVLLPVAGLE